MLKTDFLKYSVKDFLLDESFQRRVIGEGNHSVEVWPDWLKEHPEKRTTLEEAQLTTAQLKSQLEQDSLVEDLEEVWIRIENSIDTTAHK